MPQINSDIYPSMLETFKYRIYPNKTQQASLAQFFGNCRFIYNKCLDHKSSTYTNTGNSVSYNTLASSFLQQLKQQNEWLKSSPSQTLQSSIRHLDTAYQNFFKKKSRFPKFKNKFATQSIQFPQGVSVDWKNNKIIFPKLKSVGSVLHRKLTGKIKTITLSKSKDDKYYASILVETDTKPLPKQTVTSINQVAAYDLGLKSFLTDNRGNKIENPRFLNKLLSKIKYYDQVKSRKKLGSNNRKKTQTKLNQLYGKLSRQRDNFLHQVSAKIINENQVIILEDLDVEDLLQKSWSSISRNIADLSWGKFVTFLKYKAEKYGKDLVQIDRFEPSSKLCSVCSFKNNNLKLSDREWRCSGCGANHDRDINAAQNIFNLGLKKLNQDNKVQDRKGSFNLCANLGLQ